MSKIKQLVMNFENINDLEKMKEEYLFIGREVAVDKRNLTLTVLALPRKYKKKSDKENKAKNREESKNYGD